MHYLPAEFSWATATISIKLIQSVNIKKIKKKTNKHPLTAELGLGLESTFLNVHEFIGSMKIEKDRSCKFNFGKNNALIIITNKMV